MSNDNLALLAIVQPKWLEQACQEFHQGQKEEIEFGTNSSGVGPALKRPGIRYVYFKVKGENYVAARAKLARVSREKDPSKCLRGTENEPAAKYYYDFRNLEPLDHPIPLSQLEYSKDHFVRNDIAGSWVILDPLPITHERSRDCRAAVSRLTLPAEA